MKGVTGDAAAKLIARACAKKFPKTVPPDFDERFGERDSLSGHVYEKSGLGTVLRMEGARVRLLDAAVLPSLKRHLAARRELYDGAVNAQVAATRENVLAQFPASRDKQRAAIKTLEDEIAGLKREGERLETEAKALTEADKAAADAAATAAAQRQADDKAAAEKEVARLEELEAEAKRVAGELEAKKAEYAAAQAASDEKFEAGKAKARARLAAREQAEAAMKSEFAIGRKTVEKKADGRIARAGKRIGELKGAISKAEKDLEQARQAKASALRDAYVRDQVVLRSFYGKEYGGFGDVVPCFSLTNKGNLAIRHVTIGVKFDGRSTRDIGFNINDIMNLSSTGVAVAGYERYFDRPMVPKLKNKYNEDVHGIGPGQSWPKRACVGIYKFNVKGDVQRALEKVGGFRHDGWTFYVKGVDLAHADSLHATKERYGRSKVWQYSNRSTLELFRDQVHAAAKNMEPQRRIRKLTAQLTKAEAALPSEKARKTAELTRYDTENRPLVAQLAAQRQTAADALGALNRPVVGDALMEDLTARAAVLADEIAAIEKAAAKRRADLETAAAAAREVAGQRRAKSNENAALLKENREVTADREKALSVARKKLKLLEAEAAGFEKRKGVAYETAVAEIRKDVMAYGTSDDKDWLQGLDNILLAAKGLDARVDLNGAYKFPNVPLGRYLVYTTHTHRGTPVMWLQAVEVGPETSLEMGGFNSIVKPARNVSDVADALAKALGVEL